MSNLTNQSVVSQGDDQVFTIVEGEAVLMSIGNGKYYKLDDIGTRVWALIETPTSLGAICDQLVKEFNVERDVCQADVSAMLERMMGQNLVRVAEA
jgi:hypothetical protein